MCPNRPRMRALAAASFVLTLPITILTAMAAAPTEACALLSPSQIAAALGFEVDAGKNTLGTGQVCRWKERGKSAGADAALLQVALSKTSSFEIGKTPIPHWTKTPVRGIGNDAYFVEQGKPSFPMDPTLSVKKGDAVFTISVFVPKASIEQAKALEKTVALKILEKL
jgi:hypothetical protein